MLVRGRHDAFTRESAKQPAAGGLGILGSRSNSLYFLTTVSNQEVEVLEDVGVKDNIWYRKT